MQAFLDAAIAEASLCLIEGRIPIGAVLVHGDRIIGRGHNRRVQQGSAVLYGEMDALERVGRRPASICTSVRAEFEWRSFTTNDASA